MLFGALFTAYLFVRLGAEDGTWPSHIQSIPLGLTNTVLLIISSITMVWAWGGAEGAQARRSTVCGLPSRPRPDHALRSRLPQHQSVEYYNKYMHWGFLIKADAMDKYWPEIKKRDIFVSPIPSQQVFEVRGHFDGQTATSFTFAPDLNFHPWGAKPVGDAAVAKEKGQPAEEETLHRAEGRSRTLRQFPFPPTAPTTRSTSPSPAFTPSTSSAAWSSWPTFSAPAPGCTAGTRNSSPTGSRSPASSGISSDLVWITVFPILYLT